MIHHCYTCIGIIELRQIFTWQWLRLNPKLQTCMTHALLPKKVMQSRDSIAFKTSFIAVVISSDYTVFHRQTRHRLGAKRSCQMITCQVACGSHTGGRWTTTANPFITSLSSPLWTVSPGSPEELRNGLIASLWLPFGPLASLEPDTLCVLWIRSHYLQWQHLSAW